MLWDTLRTFWGGHFGDTEETLGTPFGHFRATFPQESKCTFGDNFWLKMTKLSPRCILTPGGQVSQKCPKSIPKCSCGAFWGFFWDTLGDTFGDTLGDNFWTFSGHFAPGVKLHFRDSYLGKMAKLRPRCILTPGGNCPKSVLRAFKNALLEHVGDSFRTLRGHFG